MFKYTLLVLCYCIWRVQGIDLEFSGCNKNGWLCQNANSGIGIDVTYRCTAEFEKLHSNITWRYNGLPNNTTSVAIENCNIEVTLDTNLYSLSVTKKDKLEIAKKILNDNQVNFTSIAIRNVKELKLNPNFKDLLSRLRGYASVLFEDVQLIKVLPSHIIEGPSAYIETNKMKNFNFTMRRVNIKNAEDRAVLWHKENVPIFMYWENVNFESSETAVEIAATTLDWPHSEIQETENNQVYIRNCTFKTMGTRTFIFNTTIFEFTDNYVDTIQKYAIDIDSPYTNISGNIFNKVHNYAFGYTMIGNNNKNLQFNFNTIRASEEKSLYFEEFHPKLDLQSRVSFHGNQFKCRDAAWLKRSKNDTENIIKLEMKKEWYDFMKSIESIFLMDSHNVCTDFQFPLAVKYYADFYLKNQRVPEKFDLSR